MTTLDIRGTVVGETSIAIKAPVLVATAGANITLSGVQTIDGISVGNASERVLVKDQTVQTQNGIYIAGTGAWVYAADFTSNNNIALGSLVLVTSGAVNQGILFEQTCPDSPVVIGTSLIAFAALTTQTGQSATSATSLTVGTGAKTLTVQAGKSFTANQYVILYETSAPATNVMLATVTSYSGTSLVVNVVATSGSGTHADWTVVLNNSQAGAGIAPPVGSGNVTGPGSSTTGHIATFADGTGKVLSDGGAPGIPNASSITASMLLQSAVGFGLSMLNGIVTATSTDSNTSLTFAVKTLAGADPSAADPVWFIFRDQDAEGDLDIIEVTAALNTKIPSASTLGSSNATPFAIWLLAINNAGTVELAVINCLSGTNIYPLGQAKDISTTAYGAGANSAQVPYSTSARSTVAYSILARASYEAGSTLATAGTYATAPSRTRLYIPGLVLLPGAEVQVARHATGAYGGDLGSAGTTVFATADTIPQNTVGDQYLSQAITPTSSANVLEVNAHAVFSMGGSGSREGIALFQDATANALTAAYLDAGGANLMYEMDLQHELLAGTLSSTTLKIRMGNAAGNGTQFNGVSAARTLGGVANSFIRVREKMV
jgi:hypothetical protein